MILRRLRKIIDEWQPGASPASHCRSTSEQPLLCCKRLTRRFEAGYLNSVAASAEMMV
jgi:hypothetical protein